MFWKRPKIVIAGMTRRIEAVYCDEPLGLGVGVYAIYDFANIDPHCLTGILNSRFTTWYLREKFKDKHLAGGYLAINKSTIEQLPFRPLENSTQMAIRKLAVDIAAEKKIDREADTSRMEHSIDEIVCDLFGVVLEKIP